MTVSNRKNCIKFLCSYGGKILLRPTDGELYYVGGHNRVLFVDRSISYSELMVKLVEFCGSSVTLKCRLPKGDLETLITIGSDEELQSIIEMYEQASLLSSMIKAVLSPKKSLKKISPPPSTSPSIRVSSSGSSDSFPEAVTKSGFRYSVYRIASPRVPKRKVNGCGYCHSCRLRFCSTAQ